MSQIPKSGEAVRRLDRLAPNIGTHLQIHLGMDIYAKQIAPRDIRGHLGGGGFRGQHSKVLGSCQTAGPIGIDFGSRLRIHLGIDIG